MVLVCDEGLGRCWPPISSCHTSSKYSKRCVACAESNRALRNQWPAGLWFGHKSAAGFTYAVDRLIGLDQGSSHDGTAANKGIVGLRVGIECQLVVGSATWFAANVLVHEVGSANLERCVVSRVWRESQAREKLLAVRTTTADVPMA